MTVLTYCRTALVGLVLFTSEATGSQSKEWVPPESIPSWKTPTSWYPDNPDPTVQCGDFRPQQQIKVGDDGNYACITTGQAICRDNGDYFGRWKFGIDDVSQCVTLWDTDGNPVFKEFCGATHICIGEDRDEEKAGSGARSAEKPWLVIYNKYHDTYLAKLTCNGVGEEGIPAQLKMVDNSHLSLKDINYPLAMVKFKKGGGSGGEDDDNLLWGIEVSPKEGTPHLEGSIAVNKHCEWDTGPLPNIIVFLVDDLGYNQVGYHAKKVRNHEVQTPKIDEAANAGIKMDKGYMTPWCAPSRAAFQSGRTNAYNQDVKNDIWAFDEDIGFVGGMPPGTVTLPMALKNFSAAIGGKKGIYKTGYTGKWGIGGTAWANTPMGVGYDDFIGFWGDSIEACDGWAAWTAVPPDFAGAGLLNSALPGYWQQSKDSADNAVCPYIKTLDDDLTEEEILVACKSTPRTPPKLIDLDIMEKTVSTITGHDYTSGPLFHMHALQLMHLPIQYPTAYDNETGTLKTKATNDDIRRTTNNALRFVDDIWGNITQAIRDIGQWNNTIVVFSSDNGGAIYINTVNNNYPLRGAKFTAFEGGLRVPQFLSGGWIDINLPKKRLNKSDTYMFVNDWGPTLLEMIGGSKKYLLDNKKGAPYGNEMWDYIRNSVTPHLHNKKNPIQLVRNVSYSSTLHIEVKKNSTKKMIYLGDKSVFTPRHWAPVWPREGELIPDLGYTSIKPCRPNGEALDCCYFDIASDPEENHPIHVDCNEQKSIAEDLYDDPENCDEFPTMCLNNITISDDPYKLSLWSQYGASGPFCNSKGKPIDGLDMLCICDAIDDPLLRQVEVRSFEPKVWSPAMCTKLDDDYEGLEILEPLFNVTQNITINSTAVRRVNCTGGFARVPQGGQLEAYEAQGVRKDVMDAVIKLPTLLILPEVNQAFDDYVTRKGFTEWPAFSKFPQIGFGLDSCPLKKATIVPLPVLSLTPWLGIGVGGDPTSTKSTPNLCLTWDIDSTEWCPSKTNAAQDFIKRWDYNKTNPFGVFVDNSLLLPIQTGNYSNLTEACNVLCSIDPQGTAYISSNATDKWGITV